MFRYILCYRWHKKCLRNTCWDAFLFSLFWVELCHSMLVTFCVLAGTGWVLIITCILHFAFCVFSTRVEIHFVSSLEWEGFGQNMLWRTFSPCWHGRVWSTYFEIHFVKSSAYEGLVNICRDAFRVLVNMGWDYSTHVEILFMSSLAWETFDHNVLRIILCIRCNIMGLFYTSLDTFFVHADIGWYWSTHFELHLMTSLELVGFAQHVLARDGFDYRVEMQYVFSLPWVVSYQTSWDTFCVHASIGWLWSTHVMMHLVTSLERDAFSQHMLRCILWTRCHELVLVNSS